MRVFGIIPARYGSTRLPGKVLAEIGGKPMIQHVYQRAQRSPALDHLVVATDDERVLERVRGFGGEAIPTLSSHASGTDRGGGGGPKTGTRR
jgi:3-deoxy-manno-octulosonate cytidylyltransferase (CMP-KDO synthetase)